MIAVCSLLAGGESGAVLFKDTADPAYNTQAPAGTLTNSGWQFEGHWGIYLGTPIAPRFFLAAKHVGGAVGQTFTFRGVEYHAVAYTMCPDADLMIWEVAETFPAWASLYLPVNEVGKHCVAIGRGTQRGTPIVISGTTNGWGWGAADHVQRWGENDVRSIVSGGAGLGSFLYCTFDRTGSTNECHLADGDSSGGLFIKDGTTWKLAGIHYSVDGPWSYTNSSANQFGAALLDGGGLWTLNGTNWTLIPDTRNDSPTGFYSTRVSEHTNWIQSVINQTLGADMRIAGIDRAQTDVVISLATASNRLYRIDCITNVTSTNWVTLSNNIPGTGGTVTITDPGAVTSKPKRFYRMVLLQ